jgi:hypothetical protein
VGLSSAMGRASLAGVQLPKAVGWTLYLLCASIWCFLWCYRFLGLLYVHRFGQLWTMLPISARVLSVHELARSFYMTCLWQGCQCGSCLIFECCNLNSVSAYNFVTVTPSSSSRSLLGHYRMDLRSHFVKKNSKSRSLRVTRKNCSLATSFQCLQTL